jgi:hypothetical protein
MVDKAVVVLMTILHKVKVAQIIPAVEVLVVLECITVLLESRVPVVPA